MARRRGRRSVPAAICALETKQVIEAIMLNLPPAAVVDFACASKALHGLAKVRLGLLQLQATVQPMAALEGCTFLQFDAQAFLGRTKQAHTTMCNLLPGLQGLRHLHMGLVFVPERTVVAVVQAVSGFTALTALVLEHADLRSVSPGLLEDCLQQLPRLKRLAFHNVVPPCMGVHRLMAELLLLCPTGLQQLCCTQDIRTRNSDVAVWAPKTRDARPSSVSLPALDLFHKAERHMRSGGIGVTELTVPWELHHDMGMELLRMTSLRALHFVDGGSSGAHRFLSPSEVIAAVAKLTDLTALTVPMRMFRFCTPADLTFLLRPLQGLESFALLCPRATSADARDAVRMAPRFWAIHAVLVSMTQLTRVDFDRPWCSMMGCPFGGSDGACSVGAVLGSLSQLRRLHTAVWVENVPLVQRLTNLTALRLCMCGAEGSSELAAELEATVGGLQQLRELEVEERMHRNGWNPDFFPALAGGCVTNLVLIGFLWPRQRLSGRPALAPSTLTDLRMDLEVLHAEHTLKILQTAHSLTRLNLRLLLYDDDLLRTLAKSQDDPKLMSIGNALAGLQSLQALELHLPSRSFSLAVALAVQHLQQLTKLWLISTAEFLAGRHAKWALVAALRQMHALRDLRVNAFVPNADMLMTKGVGDAQFAPQLTSLALCQMYMRRAAMENNAHRLSGLRKLVLYPMRGSFKGIRVTSWEWLAHLAALTELRLHVELSHEDLGHLTGVVPNLKQLHFLALCTRPSEHWEDIGYDNHKRRHLLAKAIKRLRLMVSVDIMHL